MIFDYPLLSNGTVEIWLLDILPGDEWNVIRTGVRTVRLQSDVLKQNGATLRRALRCSVLQMGFFQCWSLYDAGRKVGDGPTKLLDGSFLSMIKGHSKPDMGWRSLYQSSRNLRNKSPGWPYGPDIWCCRGDTRVARSTKWKEPFCAAAHPRRCGMKIGHNPEKYRILRHGAVLYIYQRNLRTTKLKTTLDHSGDHKGDQDSGPMWHIFNGLGRSVSWASGSREGSHWYWRPNN